MTLRMRLIGALILAALMPMAVAVGVAMLRAEKRAQEEASMRLETVRRQALLLIERQESETRSSLARAAEDLSRDSAALESLLGAESRPASSGVARALAVEHGLDYVEILGADDTVLSSSRLDASRGLASPLADIGEDRTHVRVVPEPSGGRETIAFFARSRTHAARANVSVIGGRQAGAGLIDLVAAVTGEPVELIDGSGRGVASAGDLPPPGGRIETNVPLGDSTWAIRLSVPEGDVDRSRRDLLETFAGIAPFALASALAVGVILAEGTSRPIRALTARAEEISKERAGPLTFPLLEERDEVRRLTLCFDRMLDALAESERQRLGAERIAAWQEVAQRIAHEVKNPLSPIKLAVENLRRARGKGSPDFDAAFEEETATILEEVESLRRLVDEFSQFVRLPRPRPVPCDLREVVTQTLALFAPRLHAAGVRVDVDDAEAPVPVIADAEQIGRVLKNVVTNAIEALEPVSDRRIRVLMRTETGPRGRIATIEMHDSGIGFAPEALRRVFEPYFTTRSDRGGTGLGMAIAYRIVTEHGGTIQAGGAPGQGATITIRLPVMGPA